MHNFTLWSGHIYIKNRIDKKYLFNTIEKKIAFYKIWEKERVDIRMDPNHLGRAESRSFSRKQIRMREGTLYTYYVDKDGEGRGKVRPYLTTKAAAA